MIGVPHLELEPGRYFAFRFVPREERFFLWYNDFLFRYQVVEREQKSPVEVALSRQRPVVYVRALTVIRTFQPPLDNIYYSVIL